MKKISKTRKIILLSSALFLVMTLVAIFHEEGALTVYDFNKELAQIKADNEQLRQENQRLIGEIQALKTDPFAVEKIAREKLNLVKPGEIVYQIIREPRNENPTP